MWWNSCRYREGDIALFCISVLEGNRRGVEKYSCECLEVYLAFAIMQQAKTLLAQHSLALAGYCLCVCES